MLGRYSYSVEVPILNFAAQGVNKFNDLAANTILNPANKPGIVVAITAIETFFNSFYAQSSSQRPVVTQADAAKLAVTLRVGQEEPIFQAPYLSYCTILNYGEKRAIIPTPINLSKSEVVVQQALANNTFSAVFNFWYEVYTVAEWKDVLNQIRKQQIAVPITKNG